MPSSDTRPLQGVLLVIAAVALFACFDTGVKIASALAPVGVVVWARYLFQVGVTAVTVLPRRGRALLRTRGALGPDVAVERWPLPQDPGCMAPARRGPAQNGGQLRVEDKQAGFQPVPHADRLGNFAGGG